MYNITHLYSQNDGSRPLLTLSALTPSATMTEAHPLKAKRKTKTASAAIIHHSSKIASK